MDQQTFHPLHLSPPHLPCVSHRRKLTYTCITARRGAGHSHTVISAKTNVPQTPLAVNGAALGVSSDVGGSICTPSGYCGVVGPKPGCASLLGAWLARTPASRPSDPSRALWVARSRTSSTRPAFCSVRGSSWDYFPAPVPYRDVTLPETLRFGYYLNDGAVEGSLACHRAVLETAEVLRKTGHECFEIEPDSTQALRLFTGIKSD
ncbi:hypothetical protein BC826DRAFT_726156 [Russula brevipes]|nr:hypothetical protein BC826DRAFT_726156 [Russula brevipes]